MKNNAFLFVLNLQSWQQIISSKINAVNKVKLLKISFINVGQIWQGMLQGEGAGCYIYQHGQLTFLCLLPKQLYRFIYGVMIGRRKTFGRKKLSAANTRAVTSNKKL